MALILTLTSLAFTLNFLPDFLFTAQVEFVLLWLVDAVLVLPPDPLDGRDRNIKCTLSTLDYTPLKLLFFA